MNNEKWELLWDVIDTYGIKMCIWQKPYEGFQNFDGGLRAQLYEEYDFDSVVRQLQGLCQDHKLYLLYDAFGVSYLIYTLTDQESPPAPQGHVLEESLGYKSAEKTDDGFLMIGPYLDTTHLGEIDSSEVVERLGLEIYHIQVLNDYYNGIPLANRMESVVLVFLKYLSGEDTIGLERADWNLPENNRHLQLQIEFENHLSAKIVEERYQCEEVMMAAVAKGDIAGVSKAMSDLSMFRTETRNSDNLREAKRELVILNVLFRKAVQTAGVHPYHIDELSSWFGRKIEVARTIIEINEINRQFIRKYCLLVQNYAMNKYSAIVTDVVNYINFHLQEELGTRGLALEFNVNASYLSRKFKKEVGMEGWDHG